MPRGLGAGEMNHRRRQTPAFPIGDPSFWLDLKKNAEKLLEIDQDDQSEETPDTQNHRGIYAEGLALI